MHFLKSKKAYLSGAIEHDADQNHNWRIEPTEYLTNRFGINVFDPFADPKQQWVSSLNEARKARDYLAIQSRAKKFVRKDLGTVDRQDFLIAYLPYKVPTFGTTHEIISANDRKKPTLLVTDMNDIAYIPLWFFGFIPIEFMFPCWNALYDYLAEVDEGKHRENNRWSLVYEDV